MTTIRSRRRCKLKSLIPTHKFYERDWHGASGTRTIDSSCSFLTDRLFEQENTCSGCNSCEVEATQKRNADLVQFKRRRAKTERI